MTDAVEYALEWVKEARYVNEDRHELCKCGGKLAHQSTDGLHQCLVCSCRIYIERER
jgi:hypothetical protein